MDLEVNEKRHAMSVYTLAACWIFLRHGTCLILLAWGLERSQSHVFPFVWISPVIRDENALVFTEHNFMKRLTLLNKPDRACISVINTTLQDSPYSPCSVK